MSWTSPTPRRLGWPPNIKHETTQNIHLNLGSFVGNSQNRQSLATEFLRTCFGEEVLSSVEKIQIQNRYPDLESYSLKDVCEIVNEDNKFITDLLREPRFRGKVHNNIFY